jgi:hypothetical protein
MTRKTGISVTESGALAGRFAHTLLYGNYIITDFEIGPCNKALWGDLKEIWRKQRISHIDPGRIVDECPKIRSRSVEFELLPTQGKVNTPQRRLTVDMIQRQDDDEEWGPWKVTGFTVLAPKGHKDKWLNCQVTAKGSDTEGWCP